MKKLLNTLYVTNEEAYLKLDGETVCVSVANERIGQFPLHTLEGIVCFSRAGATPALMGKCAEEGIDLTFFSPYGKYYCRISGIERGNVLLRKEQYHISDNLEKCCEIAKNFIIGKVYNCRWTIDRTCRDHELRIDAVKCRKTIGRLQDSLKRLALVKDLDTLRGIEGEDASLYFGIFDEMILNQKDDFSFCGRSRRPPLDKVNAMLSFGYTLLTNDCANALEGVGLDPYVGLMHRDRPGRKSMALDMMEELRPILVDRLVLTLINTNQLRAKHFIEHETGTVEFTDEGRKVFLKAWQEHKREEITHPFLKEKVQWGLIPHIQALLFARYLRHDIDGYAPFLWK